MSSFPDSLLIRAAAIRLVLTDVDGVLTDGRLWYGPSGEELKAFDARDGMAIGMLRDCGIDVGLISGRTSRPLIARADDLAIANLAARWL